MEISRWNPNDIFVFGDGDNDSEMLDHFEHSFAPSNASKKAKKNAKHVIGPCSEKSVIKEIMSLL